MVSPQKILQEVILSPNEKVVEVIPAKTDGLTTSRHVEMQNRPMLGLFDQLIPVEVSSPKWGIISGFFILTQWRIIFMADDRAYSSFAETLYDIPLHNIVDVSTRGIIEKSVHVDAHTPQGITHFAFHGNALASNVPLIRRVILQHDAADYWENQARSAYLQCRACKKRIGKGLKFCPYCGKAQAKA